MISTQGSISVVILIAALAASSAADAAETLEFAHRGFKHAALDDLPAPPAAAPRGPTKPPTAILRRGNDNEREPAGSNGWYRTRPTVTLLDGAPATGVPFRGWDFKKKQAMTGSK